MDVAMELLFQALDEIDDFLVVVTQLCARRVARLTGIAGTVRSLRRAGGPSVRRRRVSRRLAT